MQCDWKCVDLDKAPASGRFGGLWRACVFFIDRNVTFAPKMVRVHNVHIWLNISFQTFFFFFFYAMKMPLHEKERRSALGNVTPMLFLWRTKIQYHLLSVKPELVLMNIKKVFWSIENLQAVLQWVLQFGRVLMTSTHRALCQPLCLFFCFWFLCDSVLKCW